MDMLTEIRNAFAQTKKGSALKVDSIDDSFPAWVLRYDDWYGVGILFERDTEISERFSNARLWTKQMTINGYEYHLLLLISTEESLRHEFASVCAQFIDPGNNGLDRIKILNNPLEWWEKWRSLLGNSIYDRAVYSVLGELLVYERLLQQGHDPKWSGASRGTHDIELDDRSYEVKSTIQRYGVAVTINSQFQLQKTGNELNLVFCRFEESELGNSIADVLGRISAYGINIDLLNGALEKIGLEVGCSARLEKYKMLEMRKYLVDDSFPAITHNSFVDGKIPEAVIQLTYTVDLTGINYDNWISDL